MVFFNSELKKLLSDDFQTTFNSWALSQKDPALRAFAQKMLILFVNQVKEKHIKIMSEYFNEEVVVERINTNVATHSEFSIHEAEEKLRSQPILKEAFFAYREGEQLYLSFWR